MKASPRAAGRRPAVERLATVLSCPGGLAISGLLPSRTDDIFIYT
jgi:hypothetical protein